MKDLVKQYLDSGISRRTLMKRLSAVGVGAVAAKTMAKALAPATARAADAAPGAMRSVTGSGGRLFTQQLKSAGVEFMFANPSTGDGPIYDSLVDEPAIQLIKGVQEGAVVAMADGYARLSGKTGVCGIANVGLPNGMTQLVNTFKDHVPVLMVVAAFGTNVEGRDYAQDYDHQEPMMSPITKWYWLAESTVGIPDVTRRALKFAATPPSGPVFMSIPDDLLKDQATADVIDQKLFTVAMKIRPDSQDIQTVAKMLIEAKNPLLSVGDEITMSQGEVELNELAELLGLPVAGQGAQGAWSKPFSTRSPLYVGPITRTMRFLGPIDVHLNIGGQPGEVPMQGATLISIRNDPTGLARVAPVDLGMVADCKLATADLVAAIKSMATADRLKQIADGRKARIAQITASERQMVKQIAQSFSGGTEITMERLGVELENGLEKDTIYVSDCDSGQTMNPFMSWGGADKTYIATGPNILGWGVAAGFGAKLARPDRPVVAVVGDGSMLFGGMQPLWSHSRYKAPVTSMVLNNRSYNNERNRIWTFIAGDQFKMGKDMLCYNGSPDVDFAKAAQAFGVDGETVKVVDDIKPALARAKKANVDGQPYFLDIIVQRAGVGAASTYYPPYSIADIRTRKV